MIGRSRFHLREVESTQSVAFRLAELGAADGTVVSTDHQTAGRGRSGRIWHEEPGNALLFSIILRLSGPLELLSTLPLRSALAIVNVLDRDYGVPAMVKWPNDVLVDGRKISGILIQTRTIDRERVAVIGIGINVHGLPTAADRHAASLGNEADRPVDRDALLDACLEEFNCLWPLSHPVFTPAEMDNINDRLWLRGAQVAVQDGGRQIEGEYIGIGEDGLLLLRTSTGVRRIAVGDLTRGPRQTG